MKSVNCFFVAYKNIALFNHPEQPKTATLHLRRAYVSCLTNKRRGGSVQETSLKTIIITLKDFKDLNLTIHYLYAQSSQNHPPLKISIMTKRKCKTCRQNKHLNTSIVHMLMIQTCNSCLYHMSGDVRVRPL